MHRIVLTAWALISLATFSVSASDNRVCYSSSKTEYARCDSAVAAINGLTAALFWPLYWSWEIAEQVRHD